MVRIGNHYIDNENLLWNQIDKEMPIVFWGCGNNAHIVRGLLEGKGLSPTVYCDNNEKLWGTTIDGIKVLSYEQIRNSFEHYVIVITAAIGGAIEIWNQLLCAGEENTIVHVEKPFKVDDEFLEEEYLLSNLKEFEEVYEFLEDDLSKEIYINNLIFRLSGNKFPLLKYVDGDSFFDKDLFSVSESDSYVDVGAYTGDTLLRYYAFCEGKYNKIYAMEPDKENYEGLKLLIKMGRLDDIVPINSGCWDKKDILTFYTAVDKNNRGFDSPNFFKNMDNTIPAMCNIQKSDFIEENLQVDTIDNLLNGMEANVIKINALAADFEALRGCYETIKKYKPVIVGEFGTRKENLTQMLLYAKRINPNYKIYLRQKKIFKDYKTVFTIME